MVGESGCGKTTLGKILALLHPPSSGKLKILDESVVGLSARQLEPFRHQVQMIFQDPVVSLNPRHNLETILTEPFKVFRLYDRQERHARAADLLEQVGLPASELRKYLPEFSGGQRPARAGLAAFCKATPPARCIRQRGARSTHDVPTPGTHAGRSLRN